MRAVVILVKTVDTANTYPCSKRTSAAARGILKAKTARRKSILFSECTRAYILFSYPSAAYKRELVFWVHLFISLYITSIFIHIMAQKVSHYQ